MAWGNGGRSSVEMEDAASSAPESGPGTEEGREDGKRFMWTSLEVDAALQKEGLFGLEVLREDDVLPVAKKAKKKEKKPKKARKTAEEQPETDAAEELTDEQVEGATSKWDALLFGEWTMPIGVRRSLHSAGMVAPTVIQSLAFKPSLTAGVNLVACAETGSGKTLAFALPIALALLKVQRPEGDERPVLCLAVLPTRELALQVKDTIAMLFKGTPMSAFALIGGIAIQKQERVLKHRPEVLVATPGRLWDTMQKLDIKFDLRYLVLDEADRLVGDKAFREMGAIISKVKNVHTQRFIYSATILNRKNDLKMLFKLLAVKNPTVCVASHKGNLVLPYDQLLQTKSFNIKDTEEASNATLPEKLEFKVVKCFDNEKVANATWELTSTAGTQARRLPHGALLGDRPRTDDCFRQQHLLRVQAGAFVEVERLLRLGNRVAA
ncbi:ATP-dependent RNA helicase [Babesia caballi]|uniref:ATP-dependent RNA helicase n=1 Tax=Babesia caballi TaxID=5871 RepID=A0AAV4LZY1_BABCB|nr:ATP-dependent RNA helicase [Babesia caballi]